MMVADAQPIDCGDIAYENHSQIDGAQIQLLAIEGNARDGSSVAVPALCVGLFSDSDHRLIATTTTDADGHFSFRNIRRGDYRLVAQGQGFCAANARVRIRGSLRGRKPLFLHMQTRGIDSCSYFDVK
jgi:hypothetical protein